MTRSYAVLMCFIASLFLLPIQGECSDIYDYKPETEAARYTMPYREKQSENIINYSEHNYKINNHQTSKPIFTHIASIRILPASILLCVLRE